MGPSYGQLTTLDYIFFWGAIVVFILLPPIIANLISFKTDYYKTNIKEKTTKKVIWIIVISFCTILLSSLFLGGIAALFLL